MDVIAEHELANQYFKLDDIMELKTQIIYDAEGPRMGFKVKENENGKGYSNKTPAIVRKAKNKP